MPEEKLVIQPHRYGGKSTVVSVRLQEEMGDNNLNEFPSRSVVELKMVVGVIDMVDKM